MREIRLFSCNVKIVRIGWSQIQHPIIRDRMFRKCEDMPTEESKILTTLISTLPSTSSARTREGARIGSVPRKSVTQGLLHHDKEEIFEEPETTEMLNPFNFVRIFASQGFSVRNTPHKPLADYATKTVAKFSLVQRFDSEPMKIQLSFINKMAIKTMYHDSVSLPTSSKVLATPTKSTTRTKRTIVHTPTPRKFKVQVTPRKIISAAPSSRKRLGHLLLSPLKAKVSYRGQNDQKVRSRIIKEKGLYGVVVGLVRGNKPEVILNKLLKSKGFKEKAFKTIKKYVKEECRLLCGKKDASVLRGNSPDCLASVDFQKIATELRKRAPGFSQLLSDIMNTTEPVALVSSAAILLHHRNQNMSLIHHVVGQLLEHGGATDEKSTSSMTKEKQRKSFHWFLLVGLQRRVLVPSLPDDKPKHDILTLPNHSFLPSSEEIKIFESNMVHHILKVLTKHVGCLKPFTECVPKYIAHPFIEQTSKRSTYFILDLMDKNENLHDDMISILEHIHQKYIAHTSGENAEVIERKVFGGDVLTNERAYTAQLAMLNCETNYHKLGGIIHRPEGLHRMMNFLLFIYQEFYKPSSSFEQGTLFQLRNVIHRVDVTGKERVVEAFRAHFAFVEDALDAFILGAAMDVMGLENINGSPQQFNPNTLSLFSAEDQFSWLKKLAEAIIDKHINLQDSTDLQEMTQASAERDTQDILIKNMFDPMLKQYECTCRKKYKTLGYFKRHLEKEHNWQFPTETVHDTQHTDKIAVWRASFMKTALILRDTCNAYKMGDGDRIFLNAKLEMLCASVAGHTKYQLWLWRMMAYEQAVLSPKKAMEYKWNTTANISGTVDGHIPNDNLVELCVQLIKKKLKEQGANFTLKSAQTTALACQIQEELKENIRQQLSKKAAGKSRTRSDKSADIALMLNEVISGGLFKNIPGRQFENFKNFKGVFEKVNLHKLHLWISKHKEIASYEMI
ncbi:uncharacterized protein LOC134239465 [Saccostrea cucullata]|uniref:uncharacterized protein LOC134239465 n=1 Tax=Saccostrea cuccullata TaxID=36930 RepID=UPI002ED1895E